MKRRKSKVELFEQIRREYEHGVGTIQGVARKFGVHRRMVREAIESAVPRPRKKVEREKPKMAAKITSPSVRMLAIARIGPRNEKSLRLMNTTAVRPPKRHKVSTPACTSRYVASAGGSRCMTSQRSGTKITACTIT